MQSRPDISNSSMMDTSLDFHQPEDPREPVFERGFELKNETDSVYRQDLVLNAGGRGPSLQIQRDTNNVSLEFDVDFNSDQHFHVFTSEGVHLAGTDTITLAEANAMIGSDAGFGEGAYSSTYLNQTGRDAYLDTAIRFGIEATTSTETVISVDPETGSTSETLQIVAPAIVSKPLSATRNGSNQSIELIAQGDLIFNYTVADPNNDILVTQSFDLGPLDLAAGDQFSARAIAQYFQSQFDTQGLSDFTVSSLTRVVATDIDPERSLSINGTEISLSPAMGLADVIHAINNASAATNVKAEWVGSDGIALVNTSGHEGENIVLGAPAVVDQKSALGQVPGTYSGTYEIAVTGVNNSTNRPSIEGFDLQISDSGKPSDLGRLGLNTELLVDGSIPADLAIFVTGSGAVDVAAEVLPESDPIYENIQPALSP